VRSTCPGKYDQVLEEVPRVRADFGYPPLVTPTSQIVGTQAVFNVLQGRYKSFTKESRALLRGEYGRLPGSINPDIQRLALGDEELITVRPADLIAPEMDKLREDTKEFARSEEDVLSYALFPQVAEKFLRERNAPKAAPAPAPAVSAPAAPAADGPRVLYVKDSAR